MAEISEEAKEQFRKSGYSEEEIDAYQQAFDKVFEKKDPVYLEKGEDGKWIERPLDR